MIHYQLQCACGHQFDGWFAGSTGFERQARRGLLGCPRCGGNEVTRALMAPRIGKAAKEPAAPAPEPKGQDAAVAGRIPDEMRALLASMRREIEARCEYVGTEFADEARRIHNGVSPARGIYGETTEAESEALAEDGIEVARIPWVPRNDS